MWNRLLSLCLAGVAVALSVLGLPMPSVQAGNAPDVVLENLAGSKGSQGVQATIVIDRSLGEVYDTIRDTEALLQRDKCFKTVKVVKRLNSQQEYIFYQMRNLPFAYTNIVTYQPNSGTRFSRISGSFKQLTGGSRLVAVSKNKTKLVYTLNVVMDTPMPQWMINTLLKADLPRSLKLMRDEVYRNHPTA